MEQHLDAALLQFADVRLLMLQVVGDEGHLAAQRSRDLEQCLHAQRPGIVVGPKHAGVDHQHPAICPAVALEVGANAIRLVSQKRRRPFRCEPNLVGRLMTFDALCHVGARRLPFEVHDRRQRLVVHVAAGRAHGEREVGVLVIRGRVAGVEPSQRIPERSRNREACTRAVVGFAQVVVLGLPRVIVAAEIPGGAVAPDDPAGLLQPAIGIDELRTDQPRIGMRVEDADQRLEPAGGDDGVVVEEYERIAAGERRAPVAGPDETEVVGVALEAHARDVGEHLGQRLR